MITLLLLVSLFCTRDGNGQEKGVLHCGPQNLTLDSSDQPDRLTWEDDPSCSALQDVLIYELMVLTAAGKELEHKEVIVTPDQIGTTHSWNWMSSVPLKCISHSVRLRSRYKNYTSPWKQEQVLPAERTNLDRPQIFPQDRLMKVSSTVTFCCILPVGESLNKMELTKYNDSDIYTTKINNQTYSLTVNVNKATRNSCNILTCSTSKSFNGACAYFGYPPDDKDLQCETRNLQSVECHWTVGRDTGISIKNQTEYQLLDRSNASHLVNCKNGSHGRCTMEVQVDAVKRNWTIIAKNYLGKVEITDSADLTKRVHMYASTEITTSTINSRNVTLKWNWTVQQYNKLNITCQVNVSCGEKNSISEHFGVGLHSAVLKDLIPYLTYNATVRCGTTPHFWKWSDWSTSIKFLTKGDVPDTLDVWMQKEDNKTIIIWKMPLANQRNGIIEGYEVTWTKTADRKQLNTKKIHNNDTLTLSLNTTEECIVSVTAWNINGSSSPSTITIPSLNAESSDRAGRVNTSWITGSNGSFSLSWSASPTSSCGYIVDWCPTLRQCEVEWLKVPSNETSAIIFSKKFDDGVRYSFSIYACTQGTPVLLERREGYIREKPIKDGLFNFLNWTQQDSDVTVYWEPINHRNQTAFIQGYVLYCQDNNSSKVTSVITDKPNATKLTVRGLHLSSYTFTVKAKTAVGECGTKSIIVTLNSQTDNLVSTVLISLGAIFGFLSLITILCYRHWACIKQKIYPPIPKPVLIEDEKDYTPLPDDQSLQSEADIATVSELHCSLLQVQHGYVSHKNMQFDFPQTQSLPSSSFKSVFINPSYYLTMQTEDQQSDSGPKLQERAPLERCSSGYQPQSNAETLTINLTADPDSPLSCDSTYILLPRSPSEQLRYSQST